MKELTWAQFHRQVFNEFRSEVLLRRGNSDGTFLLLYLQSYVAWSAMAVRRLVDQGAGTLSVWRLFGRVIANPGLVTRTEWATSLADHFEPDRSSPTYRYHLDDAHQQWRKDFGDAESPNIDWLREWQAHLSLCAADVQVFADKRIAHMDPNAAELSLPLATVDKAIDALMDAANYMSLLLKSSTTMFDLASIQGDWQALFRPALFVSPISSADLLWTESFT